MRKKLITTILIFVFMIQSTGAYALSGDRYALRAPASNKTGVLNDIAGAMHEAAAGANRVVWINIHGFIEDTEQRGRLENQSKNKLLSLGLLKQQYKVNSRYAGPSAVRNAVRHIVSSQKNTTNRIVLTGHYFISRSEEVGSLVEAIRGACDAFENKPFELILPIDLIENSSRDKVGVSELMEELGYTQIRPANSIVLLDDKVIEEGLGKTGIGKKNPLVTVRFYTSSRSMVDALTPAKRQIAGAMHESANQPGKINKAAVSAVVLFTLSGTLFAIPSFMRETRTKPPVVQAAQEQVYENIDYGKRVKAAIEEIRKLGLTEETEEPGEDYNALIAELIDYGEGGVPFLAKALETEKDRFIRLTIIEALGIIGPQAMEAMPALIKQLDDENETVRIEALTALEKIFAFIDDEKLKSIDPLTLNLVFRSTEIINGALSAQDIRLIYANPEFLSKTNNLGKANQFSVARAISLRLQVFGLEINNDNIKKAMASILKKRNEAAERVLIQEGTDLLIACNEGPEFNHEEMAEFFSGYGAVPYAIKGEKQKRDFLKKIRRGKFNTENTVIWFSGHGSSEILCLSDKVSGYISVKELSDVLIARAQNQDKQLKGELSDVVIILESCYSADYAVNLLNDLDKAMKKSKIKSLPVIITSANRESLGYCGVLYESIKNILLKKDGLLSLNVIYAAEEKNSYRLEATKENGPWDNASQDSAIFLPLSPEEYQKLKEELKVPAHLETKPGSLSPSLPVIDAKHGSETEKIAAVMVKESGATAISGAMHEAVNGKQPTEPDKGAANNAAKGLFTRFLEYAKQFKFNLFKETYKPTPRERELARLIKKLKNLGKNDRYAVLNEIDILREKDASAFTEHNLSLPIELLKSNDRSTRGNGARIIAIFREASKSAFTERNFALLLELLKDQNIDIQKAASEEVGVFISANKALDTESYRERVSALLREVYADDREASLKILKKFESQMAFTLLGIYTKKDIKEKLFAIIYSSRLLDNGEILGILPSIAEGLEDKENSRLILVVRKDQKAKIEQELAKWKKRDKVLVILDNELASELAVLRNVEKIYLKTKEEPEIQGVDQIISITEDILNQLKRIRFNNEEFEGLKNEIVALLQA